MPDLILVPVAPGADTSIPTGQQVGSVWTLLGPDGTRAVFNDPTDRDYVGAIVDVTGLDSPDVRENATDMVEADGGIHGSFYFGRRPVTLSGRIFNVASATERNLKMTKLQRASNALRADATLLWTPDGGSRQYIKLRRQQPLRITGGWVKDFQLAMVAADPRIYGDTPYSATVAAADPYAAVTVANYGSTGCPPSFLLSGPITNPVISNNTTGGSIAIDITLTSADRLIINTVNRTITDANVGTSRYSALDFVHTNWFNIEPGDNEIRLSQDAFSSGAGLALDWRDAWI